MIKKKYELIIDKVLNDTYVETSVVDYIVSSENLAQKEVMYEQHALRTDMQQS